MPTNRLSLRLGQLPHTVLADLAAQLCCDNPALQAAAEEGMAASGSTPRLRVTRARSMPSSRLSLRLGQLQHDVLADLTARLCSESPALQAVAEECMAAHTPLPHNLVECVLLSPDLVPSILGPLETEDGAAAAVCSQWLVGWTATNEPRRRRLKQVPLELPAEVAQSVSQLAPPGKLTMAGTPDGRLLVRVGYAVHILDRSMRVLQTVTCADMVAADDDSIFASLGASLYRSTYDKTTVVGYQLEGYLSAYVVLAPGGLLFCVIYPDDFDRDDELSPDEIIALDAQTMQLRYRFGLGLLGGAQHMCVIADELYVCDTGNDRLQVFSLTGEHRRSIVGEWEWPTNLCFANDRLYLHVDPAHQDDDVVPYSTAYRQRILVLSLQGDILQVFTHPTEPTAEFTSLCLFDHKLLASYELYNYDEESGGTRTVKYGMLALRGVL